jgi:formate hydrogenlyase transcriptional activator
VSQKQERGSTLPSKGTESNPALACARESTLPCLFEHSRDLLCTHDLEGHLLSVNPAPARILGYTVEELLRTPMPELLAPEYKNLFQDYIGTIRREGMAAGRMMLLTRDGERRLWEYHNWLRADADTTPFILGMAHDITESLAAAQALRVNEKKFRSIFHDAPMGMLVATRDGRILDVNRSFAEFIGYTPEQLLGKTVSELTYPEDVESSALAMSQAFVGTQSIDGLEKRYLHKDGDLRWGVLSASLLQDHDPQSGYFIAQVVDITERKKAEEQQRTSLQQTKLLWSVGRFLNAARSVDELADAASNTVAEQLGCAAALFIEKEEQGSVVKFVASASLHLRNELLVSPALEELLCGVTTAGESVYCRDLPIDPRPGLQKLRNTGLRGFAALPLKGGDRVIGVFAIGLTKPRDFEEQAAFLETLAAEIAAGFSNCLLRQRLTAHAAQLEREIAERERAQRTMRKQEEHLRLMLQQMPGIFWAVDRDLRFTSSTGKALQELGLSENQVRGMTIANFAGTDDPKLPIISGHQRARQGEESGFEFEWGGRYYEVLVGPLREGGDAITGALGVALDISEVQETNLLLKTLVEIGRCAALHLELRALFSAVSECLRNVVKQDFAGLLVWDAARQIMRPVALDFMPTDSSLEELLEIAEKQLDPSAFAEHEVQVLGAADVAKIGFFSSLIKAGVRSICSVPLETADGPQGRLLLGGNRENAFSKSVLHLLTQVAPQLALGVANARAYQQIKELEEKLAQEKIYLEQEIEIESRFDEIVGQSGTLGVVLDLVKQVAPTDANVLISGETGTGKELIARAIHRTSLRSRNSFIKLNCAAIPSGLLESELFGYERGAFTSASTRRIGRIELADQGTLFLDEIGDLPLELQPKLLRVLEDYEFERLGSTKTVRVNIRLIAATNRDLVKDVANGTFRADLFFRLNVFPIRMPGLRNRRSDIPPLVTHFVQKYAARMKKNIDQIPTKTMNILTHWDWPGNIRELENFIERSVILTRGSVLEAPLAELIVASNEIQGTLQDSTDKMQRHRIIQALQQTGGVISGPSGAAARLGLKRTTLQSMMQRLGIPLEKYRSAPPQ